MVEAKPRHMAFLPHSDVRDRQGSQINLVRLHIGRMHGNKVIQDDRFAIGFSSLDFLNH